MAFCTECGSRLEDGARFCQECGAKVISNDDIPVKETASETEGGRSEKAASEACTTCGESADIPAYTETAPQNAEPLFTQPPAAPLMGSYTAEPKGYEAPAYEAPAYEAPVYSYSAPQTVPNAPRKKGGAGKIVLLIAAALIVVLFVVGLLGGGRGGKMTEYGTGVYVAETAEMLGFELNVADIYPDGFSVELYDGGKAKISSGDKTHSAKWDLDGNNIELEERGSKYEGKLYGNEITLEFEGVIIHLVREGSAVQNAAVSAPAKEESAPAADGSEAAAIPAAADEDIWNGDWYGYWVISDITGQYQEWNMDWWDCCASTEMKADGSVVFTLWDEDYSKDDPLAEVTLTVYNGQTAYSTDGYFGAHSMEQGEWTSGIISGGYENTLYFTGEYSDDNGGFSYSILLRPWGTDWSDIAADDPDGLPYFYNWYMDQVNAGVTEAPEQALSEVATQD